MNNSSFPFFLIRSLTVMPSVAYPSFHNLKSPNSLYAKRTLPCYPSPLPSTVLLPFHSHPLCPFFRPCNLPPIQFKSNMQQHKIDPETGLRERTVNIEAVLQTVNVPAFGKPKGIDLFERVRHCTQYVGKFVKDELWLYNRRMLTGPATEVLAMDDNYNQLYGVNYASADYLGLAQHPYAKEAAINAAKEFGLCSGGTPMALGSNKYYLQLQKELETYWDTNILIYSTGWMAGFGVIKGLIREHDFIIMDQLSHNCLQEGSNAATKNIKKFEHLNQDAMVKLLKETRANNPDSAILVVTEGLFSMDSDSPDLKFYQKITKEHGAFLLIDCAHDFGHIGEKGRGFWQVQGLEDRSNVILVGTGSKCLSTNIGFIGIKNPDVIKLLKEMSTAYMHATVINPAQAATSLAQLRILSSKEGYERRVKVLENYNYLRAKLQAKGHKIFGNPCAIMPVFVGNEVVCRLVSRIMMDLGVHVNGIEYPVVKIGQARLRVSLMPQHTTEHLDTFVRVFERALEKANAIYERDMKVYTDKMEREQNAKL